MFVQANTIPTLLPFALLAFLLATCANLDQFALLASLNHTFYTMVTASHPAPLAITLLQILLAACCAAKVVSNAHNIRLIARNVLLGFI